MKRLLSLLLCGIFVLGLAACNPQTSPPDTVDSTTEEADTLPTREPDPIPAEYDTVLDTYRSLLAQKQGGATLSAPEGASDIDAMLYDAVNKCTDAKAMGYAYKDINRDGTKELVLLAKDCKLYALLTLSGGAPVLVQSFTNALVEMQSDGTVWYMELAEPYVLHIKYLEGSDLVGTHYYATEGDGRHYYKVEYGKQTEITWEEYQNVVDYQVGSVFDYLGTHTSTKAVGFYFRPALADQSATQPPLLTLDSYADVLALYKSIALLYPDFNATKWASGDYDDLYSFSHEADYEVFHSLLRATMGQRPHAGFSSNQTLPDGKNAYCYVQKDLNGDGTDELLLLLDSYKLLALFTVKDQRPVLLDTYNGNREIRIDGEGRIMEERMTGGDFGRDREFYVYEIEDGALHASVAIGAAMNIYLEYEDWYMLKDGVRTPIDQSEWESLYAEIPEMPEGHTQAEYTLLHGSLTLQRLFDIPALTAFYVRDQEPWHRDSFYAPELTIHNTYDGITFSLSYTSDDADPYDDPITRQATATEAQGVYVFDEKDFKGTLTLGACCIILSVTECGGDAFVEGQTFIFSRIPEA